MKLDTEGLDAICGLVNDLCGIYLDSSKDYLIEGRLADLVKKHGCQSYAELARKARAGVSNPVADDVVNAITTNETLWFRDSTPFNALRFKILPELIDAKASTATPRKIRIWSAACSTGQEAYSMAMTFADIVPGIANWDLEIVGTDISSDAVRRAREARYSQLEVSRGLDQIHMSGYFSQSNREYHVNEVLRSKCRFEVRNLLQPFTSLGRFDIVFCRNVAIYFKDADRQSLFRRIADQMNPGGWLFVGSSEALNEMGPEWTPQRHCGAVCYQPKALVTV